jgi:hypothetical protein
MVEEPSHVKQLSLIHVCKIGLSCEMLNFRLLRSYLKGQCHNVFDFRFSTWISFSQAPDYTIRAVSNFFKNWQRYSQPKVHHQCL